MTKPEFDTALLGVTNSTELERVFLDALSYGVGAADILHAVRKNWRMLSGRSQNVLLSAHTRFCQQSRCSNTDVALYIGSVLMTCEERSRFKKQSRGSLLFKVQRIHTASRRSGWYLNAEYAAKASAFSEPLTAIESALAHPKRNLIAVKHMGEDLWEIVLNPSFNPVSTIKNIV